VARAASDVESRTSCRGPRRDTVRHAHCVVRCMTFTPRAVASSRPTCTRSSASRFRVPAGPPALLLSSAARSGCAGIRRGRWSQKSRPATATSLPAPCFAGLLLLLAGIPVYVWRRPERTRPPV